MGTRLMSQEEWERRFNPNRFDLGDYSLNVQGIRFHRASAITLDYLQDNLDKNKYQSSAQIAISNLRQFFLKLV